MAAIGLAALCVVQLGSYTQVSDHDTRTKLDSHGDTTAVGASMALVIHDYEQPVHVYGYTGEILPDDNCHIVSAMVAYDHPETEDTFMLVFNQAILIDNYPPNLCHLWSCMMWASKLMTSQSLWLRNPLMTTMQL